MGKDVDPAFYARVVVEDITVEITEFRSVPFQSGTSEWRRDIDFYEGDAPKRDETLKSLYKEYNIPIVDIFTYRNYLAFFVGLIKVGIEVVEVGLIPPFRWSLWQEVTTKRCFWGGVRVGRGGRRRGVL